MVGGFVGVEVRDRGGVENQPSTLLPHQTHYSTYNQPAIILEVGTLGHILLTVLTSRECGWEEVEGDRDKGGDVGKAIEVVAPL